MKTSHSQDLQSGALVYHEGGRPGKLEIRATKPLANQRDLALAYSPGVAAVSEAIHADPTLAAKYTARANLVAVVTNGTAVLGLGNIGPLAAKPVMEGKAVLFKKFADIDVFDLEFAETDVDSLVNAVAALEPTFGGINLEDIKAPECFEIEQKLRERMNVPVFHDDQHGTAVIVGAAVTNALRLAKKDIAAVKIVASGAGAAALACLTQLLSLGARRENIWVSDIEGVVYEGRKALMDQWKAAFAQKTEKRSLAEIVPGADIFLGLSAGNVLKVEMLKHMARDPLILALANPTMVCTGRSDFPNQVNNVLCFPYIFRGALDVGARTINEEMKKAAVEAIAALARESPSDVAARAYGNEVRLFGRGSLIPTPFDPRLILWVAPAVAEAAMKSGVAERPLADIDAYRESLQRFVYRSGFMMRNIFAAAKKAPARVIYADGEDERVLRAVQVALEEGIAKPIIVGRPAVVENRVARHGLSIQPGKDFAIINPEDDPRYKDYVATLVEVAGRRGVTPDSARTLVRTSSTVIAALAVRRGDADAMICGLEGRFRSKLRVVEQVIGLAEGVKQLAAMSLLITPRGAIFLADTHIQPEPTADALADAVELCARHMTRFGTTARVAFVSHSDFGEHDTASSVKMRAAVDLVRKRVPQMMVDGEMQVDTALLSAIREKKLPNSSLKEDANLLVFPDLSSANVGYQMIKVFGDALPVGPILLGTRQPAHILTGSVTSRGVVNMTAIAVAEACVAI
jgi:malate dehydrogenase (oxaloacetate-decarboxylating)(NADP+)